MSVCRLSCQRPFTWALVRTLFHAALRVVTERVGSLGLGFPKGKTYHLVRVSPNFSLYQTAYSERTSKREEFNGMVGLRRLPFCCVRPRGISL